MQSLISGMEVNHLDQYKMALNYEYMQLQKPSIIHPERLQQQP